MHDEETQNGRGECEATKEFCAVEDLRNRRHRGEKSVNSSLHVSVHDFCVSQVELTDVQGWLRMPPTAIVSIAYRERGEDIPGIGRVEGHPGQRSSNNGCPILPASPSTVSSFGGGLSRLPAYLSAKLFEAVSLLAG